MFFQKGSCIFQQDNDKSYAASIITAWLCFRVCVHNWLACNIWHQSIWNEKCNPGLLHYANTVPALTWDVLVPLNSKWTTIFHIFLSLNIWNAFCVLLWRKYEFMRSVNHCMFVFTFYTVFHQFFFKVLALYNECIRNKTERYRYFLSWQNSDKKTYHLCVYSENLTHC